MGTGLYHDVIQLTSPDNTAYHGCIISNKKHHINSVNEGGEAHHKENLRLIHTAEAAEFFGQKEYAGDGAASAYSI